MTIAVQNRQRKITLDTPKVKRLLTRVMTYLGCAEQELSLVWGNDELLHNLNRDYRQKDRPTNVLAFPQTPVAEIEGTALLLGDVIVSLPTAAREAHDLNQALETRVVYLAVHGLLHLLGYDHVGSATERNQMESLEHEILAYLAKSC